MWKILRNINEGKQPEDKAKIITYRGNTKMTDKHKAEAFLSSYKSISKLKIEKTNKAMRKKANDIIKSLPEQEEDLNTIAKGEVEDAIKTMKSKQIGSKAREELRHLFQHVWRSGHTPQSWRTADIRPIPKSRQRPERPYLLQANLVNILSWQVYGENSVQPP